MSKPFIRTTIGSSIQISLLFIFSLNFANSSPQQTNIGIVVPSPDQQIDDPSKQVVVQHPVTINVAEATPLTTYPPVAPLKTRVVVIHNNMVPVPIECFQPPDSGTCSKDLARIYYDHETRTCKPFSYTGCGGNANRFQSIKNCYRICHPYRYKIRPKLANQRTAPHQRTKVIKIKTIPALPAAQLQPGTIQIPINGPPGGPGVIGGPQIRAMGMSDRGPPLPYPPTQYNPYGYPPPPPPFPPQFGSQFGYFAPQQRQLLQSQPIIQKQLVRSLVGSGMTVQEKVVGDSPQSVSHNSGQIYRLNK